MDNGSFFFLLAVGPVALAMFGIGFAINALVGSLVTARSERHASRVAHPKPSRGR